MRAGEEREGKMIHENHVNQDEQLLQKERAEHEVRKDKDVVTVV